jgi:hypothetical protein
MCVIMLLSGTALSEAAGVAVADVKLTSFKSLHLEHHGSSHRRKLHVRNRRRLLLMPTTSGDEPKKVTAPSAASSRGGISNSFSSSSETTSGNSTRSIIRAAMTRRLMPLALAPALAPAPSGVLVAFEVLVKLQVNT